MVRGLVEDAGITPREVLDNKFGERSFTFTGTDVARGRPSSEAKRRKVRPYPSRISRG